MATDSRLPNWSRGHVATHIARNADALTNLCTWAKTGVPHLMYASREERDSEIEDGAKRNAADIVADVKESAARLSNAFAALTETELQTIIRTGPGGAGPSQPVSRIPWMRLREVEIHLVDLDLAPTFADTPIEYLTSLLAEVIPNFDASLAGLTLNCSEGSAFKIGDGDQVINGSTGDITAWLLGRANSDELARLSSDQEIPTPPKWL
ncbi:mycothiol-dependent maleylpyruvate isomerase [mine drainage metagenome]|uniref:Mycothiol-dependent maleylpyruvate isomerase n=1 Tax=mine drainage metagenome TaxID=410659 RepID=A0A1J5Q585_9ZZZZ